MQRYNKFMNRRGDVCHFMSIFASYKNKDNNIP